MYAVYRQTDFPTAVDQAIYCNFTNGADKELLVASGSVLHVYRLNPYVHVAKTQLSLEEASNQFPASPEKRGSSSDTITKLECVLRFPFYGNIVSMAAGRLPKASTDCLFLAFDEAKLSIVQYDPDEHGLKIISLHCFEDDLLRAGFTRRTAAGAYSMLRVDPGDRCAAMLVYGRHLAIIPFSRDVGLFGEEAETPTPKSAKTPTTPLGSATSSAGSSPYLHSYSVPLDLIDSKLQNVSDFCFLHGYYEPTILFLYEPIQTTSGRLAVRHDTFCILAVSLNVKDRIYAVIWTVNNLPFDCFRCAAIPKPIGGVLVFAVNSVVYLNQSVPPYGVVLNANGREASAFPLRAMEDKQIQLDGSHAEFVTPSSLVLSLRSGDLYVVTLLVDNMNAVKGIHFDKCQSSVIPSVLRKCNDGYIFLGSRLGNSLLLKYWETNSFAVKVSSEIPAKRQRLDEDDGAAAYGAPAYSKLEDDLELYGEIVAVGTVESARVSQYSFEVCDSILNIGPIRQCVYGEPANVSEEYHGKLDPLVDLVTVSGHGKNGCLVVLQRSVRPQVLTTNVIPGAQCLWAVGLSTSSNEQSNSRDEGDGDGAQQKEANLVDAHQHLLLSKEVMTMALELKAEISELESSGFIMNQRTIAAGTIGDGRYVIQITPMAVALLEGAVKVQNLALDLDFPICQASIADPYVALLTENGELLLLTLLPDAAYQHYELIITQPEIYQNVPATAISAYKDLSGIFDVSDPTTETELSTDPFPDEMDSKKAGFSTKPKPVQKLAFMDTFAGGGADDEDALLYGDDGASGAPLSSTKPEPVSNRRDPHFDEVLFEGGGHQKGAKGSRCIDPSDVMPSYWLAVARENGFLEIFRLPDFHLVYMVKKFPVGFRTLFDTDPIKLALEQDKLDEKLAPVQELLLIGLGSNKCRPHLLAVVDEELLIYEAFPYTGQHRVSDHLCLRFKRISHSAQLRNAKSQRAFRRRPDGTLYGGIQSFTDPQQRLYFFEDVSGYSGVFVAGSYPYWFFMTSHGILRCHPMHVDGKVLGFSPFHNVNCHRGFTYLNEKREMRICQLPAHISYDASYPAHKVNLKKTAHHIVYHLDSRTYAVTTSEKVLSKTLVTMAGDEKQFDVLDKEDPNFIYPCVDKFKIQLYSSETWEPIPEAEIVLEDFEHVTVLREVQLKSEGTRSGLESYLALGTIYNYGEEVMVRGRLMIAEVVEVVPEPDKPLTKNKLKILYSQEQKGPVTSLCSVQGYLLTGMGPKVYIWSFKDNDLQGISFLDLQIYIHQMISIRNIALIGDVYKSVCLLRYQESSKALSLASRDPRGVEVYAMEFMIDNKLLGFLVSDADGDVCIYTYQPEAKESLGGQRLVHRADINVGARINSFCRIKCHIGDQVVEKKVEAAQRHLTLFSTLDGAVGYFIPLSEKVYRRLLMLQNVLFTGIQHEGGLNPKAFRSVKQRGNVLFNPQKNILDGDLLFTYSNLSLTEKSDTARRIGTTREQLQDDLLEIDRTATHF